MLARVLEPEVMDSLDEARDYDSMDHAEVNRSFVADLLAARDRLYDPSCKMSKQAGPVDPLDDWDEDSTFDVLDLGAGTARIPIKLCQVWEDQTEPNRGANTQDETPPREAVRVMAVDMAVSMLELARLNLEIASLTAQVQLDQIDAKKMPFEDRMFDCVMSNSIVHHLPEPASALAESVRVCRGGGLLFFRDLLRPNTDEEVAHLVQTYAGEANDSQQKMFNDSLRAALSLDVIRILVARFGFDPNTVEQTTDRHWTWTAVKPT